MLVILLVQLTCLLGRSSTAFISTINIEPKTNDSCAGSLILYEDFPNIRRTLTNTISKLETSRARLVELAGCWCFTLYSGRKYKGSSQNIGTPGLHRLTITKVRSLARRNCSHFRQAEYYKKCITKNNHHRQFNSTVEVDGSIDHEVM